MMNVFFDASPGRFLLDCVVVLCADDATRDALGARPKKTRFRGVVPHFVQNLGYPSKAMPTIADRNSRWKE